MADPPSDKPVVFAERLFVENWTAEDFERERVWRAACDAVHAERQRIAESLGWVFRQGRRSSGNRLRCAYTQWAIDPATQEEISISEAHGRILTQSPGCLPEWPVKPELPPSTQALIMAEIEEVKPMPLPVGRIFYLGYDDSE